MKRYRVDIEGDAFVISDTRESGELEPSEVMFYGRSLAAMNNILRGRETKTKVYAPHREDYSAADAQVIVNWLNRRSEMLDSEEGLRLLRVSRRHTTNRAKK